MAFQGEREQGGLEIEMREEIVESMAQDEIPEQDISVQDEFPQPNPEPEMGAAAEAAVYDTPPPHRRQIHSPAPGGSAPDSGEATATDPSAHGPAI